ncbi:polyprenyl synthetase family protein [Pseudonocardia sp. TRM90224]|uniref:polyprenyl synthetase family protein n=1 Tax=Pseudonocardia sp. TRM90224 TaxID=2812678 RepID=UPI001E5FE34E|nr:polyprenyl synthetase family protein [Pseudonocardia sp. TRM90224]
MPAIGIHAGTRSEPATARAVVTPVLRRALDALEPVVGAVGRYHLGFADARGEPIDDPGGKLIRANLMMTVAAGIGLPPADLGTPGAAVELLHNSTLLHDDIIDRDDLRRGRPAAWRVFGTELAILAGDGLQVAALGMVAGERQSVRFADAIGRVLAGQALELRFPSVPEPTVAEYERIATEKTGALLGCALAWPAVLAREPDPAVRALERAGKHLGIAWQASNDVEDIWGDPAVTGKPLRGDLRRRGLTAPVLATLRAGGHAAVRFGHLWRSEENGDEHLGWMADLIEEAGGRAVAEDLARRHLDLATEQVAAAGLAPAAATDLTEFFDHIVYRH